MLLWILWSSEIQDQNGVTKIDPLATSYSKMNLLLCPIRKHYEPIDNQYLKRIINWCNSGLDPLFTLSLISWPLTMR